MTEYENQVTPVKLAPELLERLLDLYKQYFHTIMLLQDLSIGIISPRPGILRAATKVVIAMAGHMDRLHAAMGIPTLSGTSDEIATKWVEEYQKALYGQIKPKDVV